MNGVVVVDDDDDVMAWDCLEIFWGVSLSSSSNSCAYSSFSLILIPSWSWRRWSSTRSTVSWLQLENVPPFLKTGSLIIVKKSSKIRIYEVFKSPLEKKEKENWWWRVLPNLGGFLVSASCCKPNVWKWKVKSKDYIATLFLLFSFNFMMIKLSSISFFVGWMWTIKEMHFVEGMCIINHDLNLLEVKCCFELKIKLTPSGAKA